MNRISVFHNGILQGLISLILVISITAGLFLPGMNMKIAKPQDPLDAQEILDINMLEVSENISSLTPIVVPTGVSAQPMEPQDEENSEDSQSEEDADPQEEEEGNSNGNQEGDQNGLQGEEGGELVPEVALILTWAEGSDDRSLACQPSGTVSADILNNSLSGGMLKYELFLTGTDASEATIENVSYKSDYGTDNISQRGSLHMQGGTYEITVSVVSGGQRVPFNFQLNLISDVTLKMEYILKNGTKDVTCENTKTKTTADVYSDDLKDGKLQYTFSIVGVSGGVTITSITCFQSGSDNTKNLGKDPSGEIELLLKDGKTGENTFTVRATDASNKTYHFTINIPYKPRGAEILQIETYDLVDGQTVTTGSSMNFRVSAYRPEDSGNVYIPVEGTDTTFRVTFNGLVVDANSSNGKIHDYIAVPSDPVIGDTNTHTIEIYVEDSYGNWGQKTMTLTGKRAQDGQIIGTASIYVDMTVLGLGIQGPISYDVLSNEAVSYVVLKALLGQDMGEIFGSAKETFGWRGIYTGSPEPNRGFYLKSLTTGLSPVALDLAQWPMKQDENDPNKTVVDLDVIDEYFGAEVDMATLWRCLARNGPAKSEPDPDGGIGQFDYTSCSGWLYTVNGIFPMEGMDTYYLKDGDTLTLLYSLAGGWDVGASGAGENNQAGYCIQAVNGTLVTNHVWEEDQCVCCGLILSCKHENKTFLNKENGQHVEHCDDCGEDVGSPAYHTWIKMEGDLEKHVCEVCSFKDDHFYPEETTVVIKQPTCTEAGEVQYTCDECGMQKTDTPTGRHEYGGSLEYDLEGHFKQCQVEGCEEKGERTPYSFYWDDGEEDYLCQCGNDCDILHDFTLHNWSGLMGDIVESQSTCRLEVSYCSECGNYLYKEGTFEDRHTFSEGICSVCGKADPDYHEHTWGEWTVVAQPDCVNPGMKQRECSGENCDNPVETEEVQALGHTWGDWYEISPATCTEDGIQEHACSVCGAKETDVNQSAYGHSWSETFVDATCDQDGYYEKSCGCGAYESGVINAYGHSFADGYCITCGESDPDYVEEDYSEEYSMFAWFRRKWYSGNNGEERI